MFIHYCYNQSDLRAAAARETPRGLGPPASAPPASVSQSTTFRCHDSDIEYVILVGIPGSRRIVIIEYLIVTYFCASLRPAIQHCKPPSSQKQQRQRTRAKEQVHKLLSSSRFGALEAYRPKGIFLQRVAFSQTLRTGICLHVDNVLDFVERP